jgi:glycosyltransferase involved in cell wall biosynthesis
MQRLLIVGPQPPPVGGGTVSVQSLLDELAAHGTVRPDVINTSPPYQTKKTGLIKRGTLRRAAVITRKFSRQIKHSDAALVFGTPSFLFSLGSLLLWLARYHRVPLYLKPLGGNLLLSLGKRNTLARGYRLRVLRAATGVLVQTNQLRAELNGLGCSNVHYVPGYRPALRDIVPAKPSGGTFRIIFLSQIFREKGPLLLLEALRILTLEEGLGLECDFYGPILDEDRREFLAQLEATPGAGYRGVAEVGTTSQLMARYDVLVFPTHFSGEGHPGVILEAMQAGIPVISTRFRSIPELISDGENGFLVPVGDSRALAAAIKRLALDPRMREKMGAANRQRGREFRSDIIVSRMMDIVFAGGRSSAGER